MQFFSGKKLTFFLHIVAWTILFILPSYFLYVDSMNDSSFLYRSFYQTGIFIVIFYVNYLWLIPEFFFKKRKGVYFILASILIIIMSFGFDKIDKPFDEKHMMNKQPPPEFFMEKGTKMKTPPKPSKSWPTYNFILTSILISSFGFGLRFSEKLIKNEKKRKETEKEKLNSELAFLKNQLNPHFFFNTLNNIYSLIQHNTETAQKSVIQLSKLMRYVLYESENSNVKLSHDIEFMKNYIELAKLRLSNKVSLSIKFPDDYPDISFPPLLFIPFIENAFKHGISYQESSSINVELQANRNTILFLCSNTVYKSEKLSAEPSGIGLENVSKRLSLLFPEKHTLEINKTDNLFNVKLNIDLTKTKET